MLQANVSHGDGGVVFKTFSERDGHPRHGVSDSSDAVSQTDGAQTSLHTGPRRGRDVTPPAPQKRPSWTSGDQTFSTWAQTRPNKKNQVSARNTPRRPQTRERRAYGAERKTGDDPKTDRGETRFGCLRWHVVLLCRSPIFGRSFWVAGAPGLPSSLLVCVLGPAWFQLLSSRFIFTVSAPKVFQVSPVIRWYAAIRVAYLRRPPRTDGTR